MGIRDDTPEPPPIRAPSRWFAVEPGEWRLVALSAVCFFCLLCAWYTIRPVREAMGLSGGVDNLPWLFVGTMGVMLVANPVFSFVVSRFSRRTALIGVYAFFALNLVAFFVLFRRADGDDVVIARTFYIWASVFNLFILSLFWSIMADAFSTAQAERLFGVIGVGGTLGAIVGSGGARLLIDCGLDETDLPLVSLGMLMVAAACVLVIFRYAGPGGRAAAPRPAIRGTMWAGITHVMRSPYLIGISVFLLCLTMGSTIVYFIQARLIDEMFATREEQTRAFALIDLLTNVVTILVQLFLTGYVIRRIGVGWTLALLPLVTVMGFLALAAAPVLVTLVVFQVARRGANYALSKPARESLFTVLTSEDKYKSKNFIDTFVYRGGDVAGAGAFAAITGPTSTIGIAGVSLIFVPLMLAWAVLSVWLGRRARIEVRSVHQCEHCGYSMRGGGPRCPECGRLREDTPMPVGTA